MTTNGERVPPNPVRKLWTKKQYLVFVLTMCGTATILILAEFGTTVGAKEALAVVLDLILVLAIPALAYASFHQLRTGKMPTTPQMKHYRAQILGFWALALFVFDVFAKRDTSLSRSGFAFRGNQVFFGWCLVLAVGLATTYGLFHWLTTRGWLPSAPRLFNRFPQTRSEKMACLFLLAPTVGFCEELVYRSYVLNEISHWWKDCPVLVSLLVSCLLFALGHLTGGIAAFLQTFLAGALFTWPVVHSGTLYPSIVMHTIYDAVVLVWIGPKLVRQAGSSLPPPI